MNEGGAHKHRVDDLEHSADQFPGGEKNRYGRHAKNLLFLVEVELVEPGSLSDSYV
jgi:hypothetical protein